MPSAIRILSSEFKYSADSKAVFPKTELSEVALIGRSNVGKSTLINSLLTKKKLARVGRTPGVTKNICFYQVIFGEKDKKPLTGMLVDLPGFGFAKLSKDKKGELSKLLSDYLLHRNQLTAILLLQDIRRDFGVEEEKVLELSRGDGLVLVLTKKDKLGKAEIRKRIQYFTKVTKLHPDSIIPVSNYMSADEVGEEESGICKLRELMLSFFSA